MLYFKEQDILYLRIQAVPLGFYYAPGLLTTGGHGLYLYIHGVTPHAYLLDQLLSSSYTLLSAH